MIHLEMKVRSHIPPSTLEGAAAAALELTGSAESDLTLVLTDDDEIRLLNRNFRATDAPTDVLSFPADELDPETGRRYLGDVVLSLPRATEQAQAHGHAPEDEVQLLVVHGVLHLLGHDHGNAAEKARMWQLQARVLEKLGMSVNLQDEQE